MDLSPQPRVACAKLDGQVRALEGTAFLFLARGGLRVLSHGGSCERMAAGDLLFVPEGPGCEVDARRAVAEVILLEVPSPWAERALSLAERAGEPGRVSLAREDSQAASRAGQLLRLLAAHPSSDDTPLPLRLAAAVVELLALAADLDPDAPERRRRHSVRRERFLAAIDAARTEPLESLSLASLAKRLGISERHLSRLFPDYLEQSFRGWATDVRLERARKLLRETDCSVIEVAEETGWRSLSHFNTRFKLQTGYSPSTYREVYRRETLTTSE